MNDKPADIILPLLREIRAKQDDQSKQISAFAQGQVSMRAELKTIREDVHVMRDSLHEVAIAIDGHNDRLDRIERHLGLDEPKH